jgi:transcription elongation GreA/GreB family factor
VSVLSPAGLALLGRRPGSVVMATLRNGWPFTVRVLDAAPLTEKEMT